MSWITTFHARGAGGCYAIHSSTLARRHRLGTAVWYAFLQPQSRGRQEAICRERGALPSESKIPGGAHPVPQRLKPRPAVRGSVIQVGPGRRSEEHTSELQSRLHLVCRLLLEKKKKNKVPSQTPVMQQ